INHFGYYEVSQDTWFTLENIPGIKKVKAGGALTAYDNHIYAFKGGNLQEFWAYHIPEPNTYAIVNHNTISENLNIMSTLNKPLAQLIKIIPNPASHKATLYYSVSKPRRVQIKLYNAVGNLIANLVDSDKSVGDYYLTLNTLKFAKGVYFLRYQTETEQLEVKLIIQ
ncbi:MAG: T9SS type A sorting domain-containing protein, partial [candidate division WOR-3 bacterium]|nr:T9SS type A sorting domain-containing protein [candidate division WOR-3 bacterium]